ncbi:MAG TPA: cell wall metabolism sensor histidine kinase WalK [Thermoanaerobacterales bacterium]|jgi:two-component system sensor histidine kinase VicK|nr:cell wall metabolism sensor histidine kinase WalK [Thermoanaerobacterales bacterium]
MFKSIQWKLVVIYIMLILLAMEVVGVFLVQSLEKYHFDTLSNTLDGKAQLISSYIERHMSPVPRPQEINDVIMGFSYEMAIAVLDESGSIITSTDDTRYQRGLKLLTPEITQATFGTTTKDTRIDSNSKIPYMYYAYPIKDNEKVVGIIYLISSIESIYDTIAETKTIIFMATLLGLIVTGILGYALSRTITGPIQEVTKRAASMAQGDFDQQIQVKSDDEIGKLTKMFNFLTTRLKDTMEEISDEKEKMEAILINMADGVIALNDEGQVIHINPVARQMLSLEDDITGKDFSFELKKLLNINMKQLLDNDFNKSETLIKTNDAIIKSIYAPLTRENRIVGHILVLQDITKHHRLETMRKEFVANVSHELRTPLTTIKSYTETLLDGALGDIEISRQFMGVVNAEADRMTRLVNNLLELSRLDNKETSWAMNPINPGTILKDVINKMDVSIKKKKQILETYIPDDPVEIFADRDKIEQVFQNILSNANKYTPEDGKIIVQLECADKMVKIAFQDEGIGIPKEDLPRIFERFYRVDKTRSREMGGTGLGLSIAHEIVKAHNGNITIDSEPGQGTCVTIQIPAISSSV